MKAASSLEQWAQHRKIFFLFEEADIGSSLKIMTLHFSPEVSVTFKHPTKLAVYVISPTCIFNIQLLYYTLLKKDFIRPRTGIYVSSNLLGRNLGQIILQQVSVEDRTTDGPYL